MGKLKSDYEKIKKLKALSEDMSTTQHERDSALNHMQKLIDKKEEIQEKNRAERKEPKEIIKELKKELKEKGYNLRTDFSITKRGYQYYNIEIKNKLIDISEIKKICEKYRDTGETDIQADYFDHRFITFVKYDWEIEKEFYKVGENFCGQAEKRETTNAFQDVYYDLEKDGFKLWAVEAKNGGHNCMYNLKKGEMELVKGTKHSFKNCFVEIGRAIIQSNNNKINELEI